MKVMTAYIFSFLTQNLLWLC